MSQISTRIIYCNSFLGLLIISQNISPYVYRGHLINDDILYVCVRNCDQIYVNNNVLKIVSIFIYTYIAVYGATVVFLIHAMLPD